MFRLFLRDVLVAAVLFMVLAGAAMVLGLPVVAPPPTAPWSREIPRLAADPALLARDGALLVFALATLAALLRVLSSGLRLLGRDYPALAHLLEALASRLVRRAGALVGVLLAVLPGSGVARTAGAARTSNGPVAASPVTLVQQTSASPSTIQERVRLRHQVAHAATFLPRKKVGLALRYTVQPDDTMDAIAARFGLSDWRPIMYATRGLPQPVGDPLANPDLIFPGQILHIPLPCPALRVSDGHVLYVVQQEDSLSGIAARFLGDWHAYRAIADLNRGVHQPVGETLHDDNLIQPGWVLRLPQQYVVDGTTGVVSTRPMVVADTRPVRLRHNVHPRRHLHTRRIPVRAAASLLPALHLVQTEERVSVRIPAAPREQAAVHRGQKAPLGAVGGPGLRRRRPVARPVLHAQPLRQLRPVVHHVRRIQGGQAIHRRLTPRHGAPAMRRLGAPPRLNRRFDQAPPFIHVPDLQRDLPVAFVLGFLALATATVAARRRHLRRGLVGVGNPSRWSNLTPSVQRTLRAALDGVEGSLARVLRRTLVATSGGANAAYVVAALDRVSHETGLPYSLASAIRLLVETAETIRMTIEVPRLAVARVDKVVDRLGIVLGVPIDATSTIERGGTPVVTLTVKTTTLVTPATAQPHPAPLLVPLGATADGAVVHLQLGRTGGLLIAGGGQALVATLLASTIYQASPHTLRLLVASDDDELRKALPQLEHLEAPPADARDPQAVANLIAQAHTLVLERYERYGADAHVTATTPPAPPIPCLLILAGIEELSDEALDRLDAVAHTGPVCGVHLIATTSDPTALAASGMLSLFRTRLARRLASADNTLVCPDADAGTLGPHEVLLYGLGTVQTLKAFNLTPPEVREVFATVAVATLPPLPVVAPVPPPAPPSTPPTPPDASVAPPPAHTHGAVSATATPAHQPGEDPDTEDDAEQDTAHIPDTPSASTTGPVGPAVRLDLLGGITVYVHGQPINILPRERNLLAALAIMGPRPVRRADLIEALFADDEDGGNTLSHALSDLRAALRKGGLARDLAKDLILKSSGGYSLHQDLIAVDLWQFDALLREAEELDDAEAGPVRARAFALYHGPLCQGEALDFVEEHGYRWMKSVLPALYNLADYYRESGDLMSALHWARRLLADAPCDDHAHQLVMNVLAEMGNAERLDAHMQELRRQYAANKQKVDPYTLRLYEQLRRQLKGEAASKAG